MPILGGIKLAVKGDALTLSATDLERAIVCSVPIENQGEGGAVVLNGEILLKVINVLPADGVQIKMAEAGERVVITSGEATFDLLLMALEDYPEISTPPQKRYAALERAHLQRGLEQTAFAAMSAKETSRLNLTGIDLVFQDAMVKMVATNGYRLAYREEKLTEPVAQPGEHLVSADALKDLSIILTGLTDEQIVLYHEGSHLFFQAEQVLFMARLISEEYPDFDRVIPKGNKIGLHLDRQTLLSALQRTQITTATESGAVLFRAQGEKLRLSSSSVEKGQTEEMLTLHKSVSEIAISFRGEYLIDALRRMSSNQVVFWLADPESAGLLEPAGDDSSAENDRGFLYVCMPIRMDL
jgi:DNA polymerase-3 subunit beta